MLYNTKMGVLETLIFLVDDVGMSPYMSHFVGGCVVGFLFGLFKPRRAFYAATIMGFSKETIDFLKHSFTKENFYFLTDPKYGLYDAIEDFSFWILGGYFTYRVLQKLHTQIKARVQKESILSYLDATKEFQNLKTYPKNNDIQESSQVYQNADKTFSR